MIKYILFIIILSLSTNCISEEKVYFESENDTIVLKVENLGSDKIIKKKYTYIYNNKIDYIETLWKKKYDFFVYSEVPSNKTYILQGGLGVIASDFLLFYADADYLNDSWTGYNTRIDSDKFSDEVVLLAKTKNKLIDFNVENGDTLYTIQIDNDSDVIKNFTYDQNLNVKEISFLFIGKKKYTQTFRKKN